MEEKKDIDNWDNLIEEMIDNILSTSDKEILEEVEEDYGDPLYKAKRVRSIINKCREQIQKNSAG